MDGERRGAIRIPLHLLGLPEQPAAEELSPVSAVVWPEEAVVQTAPAGVAGAINMRSVN